MCTDVILLTELQVRDRLSNKMFRAYEGEEVQSASVNTRFKIRCILSRSHKKYQLTVGLKTAKY